MTALAESRPSLPAPGTPVISAGRIQDHARHNARYGDAVWPLAPLSANPSSPRLTIHWARFPAAFAGELRYLAWLLINEAVPDTFLLRQAGSFRARLGMDATYNTTLAWKEFARWLGERGHASLGNCTGQDYRDYTAQLARNGASRDKAVAVLNALSRLWVLDTATGRTLGMAEPPWHQEGADDFLPAATRRGENATDPITPATMGPLLIWALRAAEDLAPDIIRAWEARRSMTEHAAAAGTPGTRAALLAYLSDITTHGRPLPAVPRKGRTERTELAVTYISAVTGASPGQVYAATRGPYWRDYLRRNPGPCPLPAAITAMIDGRPWTSAIDFTEAATLMKHLVAALFTVLSYLTGMRPGEVLGLHAGCCPDPESGPHLINGNVFKTARDEDGNHLSAGQPRNVPWVAIPPVVTAIRVLEQITPEGLLFASAAHDFSSQRAERSRPGTPAPPTVGRRIEDFVSWANTLARSHGRPHEAIPDDPHGALGTARFRRTLAWHIARQPGGLVALAIQYGHLRTAISGHYASRGRDGIHDLLDIETARATADALATLNEDLAAGGAISGPAARRAISAAAQAPNYAGAIITARDARNLLRNPSLAVHDNPRSLLLCVYDPRKALCRRDGQRDTPSLDRCVATCANIAHTDRHADRLTRKAGLLEKQAAGLAPEPLAERLRARAGTLRAQAEQHHQSRITAQENPR